MSYIHGLYDPQYQAQSQPEAPMTWLDILILSNPQGVMKVLADHGYTGYLAPQDEDEMIECCMELMDKYGDQAVIDLLRSHPLYDVISEMSREDTKVTFKNATGESEVITTIRSINFTKLLETALIILGAFYLAGRLWGFLTKKDA
jgi:hypothetical protein